MEMNETYINARHQELMSGEPEGFFGEGDWVASQQVIYQTARETANDLSIIFK